VAHRLARRLRERAQDAWARLLPAATCLPLPVAHLRPDLPHPPFGARKSGIAGSRRDARARLLGCELDLTTPINWRPTRGPVASRLARFQLHAMEFVEGLDDRAFARLVEDWLASNPRRARGAWYDAWHPYPLSLRCVVWLHAPAVEEPLAAVAPV
jgi:hypothetical protein